MRKSGHKFGGVRLSVAYLCIFIATIATHITVEAVKVLDINDKLPELIDKHPEKGWLIKFYAPWCHHCQQLEPTYNNVAERVYSKYNDLIVGRVDCTKTGALCGKYGVDSYPTIIYIDKSSQVKYRGDRSEASLVAFAERLQGPTVNVARSCHELNHATDKHGLVILSTISNSTDEVRKEFESLALEYKSTYWFYRYLGTCDNHVQPEGLYVLKRHLAKPIRFELKRTVANSGQSQEGDNEDEPPASSLKAVIVNWLNKESFPVYGPISYRNIERALGTEKLLVVAVLDHYKPARRFSLTSSEFHKRFEELAKAYAAQDDSVLFAWSSDLELVQYITITQVSTPNVIIVKPDFSYHLFLSDDSQKDQKEEPKGKTSAAEKQDADRLAKLGEQQIRALVTRAREGKLAFTGGSNYLFAIMRYLMSNLNKFLSMYRANPLLVSLIFGFPGVIIIFVIYTTCFHQGGSDRSGAGGEGEEEEEEEDFEDEDSDYAEHGEPDEEERHLLSNGHLKQE